MAEFDSNATHGLDEPNSANGELSIQIENQAERLLMRYPHLRSGNSAVHFECNGETLTISGRVFTYFDKQLLQEAFRSIDSLKRIDNQVVVVPDPQG